MAGNKSKVIFFSAWTTEMVRPPRMPNNRPEVALNACLPKQNREQSENACRVSPPVNRILLVTHYYAEHCGGVEIVAGKIAEELAVRGWRITWISSGPAPEIKSHRGENSQSALQSEPEATTSRADVVRVPMRSWNYTEDHFGVPYPLWGPISLWKLCAQVRQSDVIHLHDSLYFGNIVAYVCARLSGKPIVITQHVDLIPFANPVLRIINYLANRIFACLLLGGCFRCVFYSTKVRDFFSRLVSFRRKPEFIANGVSSTTFHPVAPMERRRLRAMLNWPADKFVMLFVGRFVPKKNLALIRRMAAHFPRVAWVFVGWGPENPATWGLPNVNCSRAVDHELLSAYYQAADLLVLPSIGEGFPLVAQEAMACGLPVLISKDTASGAPGIETAVFVSDLKWERIVSLLTDLMDDPVQLKARADAGLEYAHRHWNWDAWISRYEQLFAEVIATSDQM